LLLVAVAVAAVVGLVSSYAGRSEPEPAALDRAPVPALRLDHSGTQTWYCASGRATTDPAPPSHRLLLTQVGPEPVSVDLRPVGESGAGEVVAVTVRPGTVEVVDVGEVLGDPASSVVVSAPSTTVVVEHQLASSDSSYVERLPCATTSSGTWFFPAVTTTRDASALLTLFNPFPADAGVDVRVVLDTGVRTPRALSGIVVPSGTVRVVDLGQTVQRREQFAVVVRARSGRVVAELAQSRDGALGARGLRMTRGVARPERRWVFAGGFTGPGAAEQLVLHNPGRERANAVVQVTPYGGVDVAPEPIEVEVPAQRWVVVDLSAEARVPGEGFHSVVVDSPEHPLVVARTMTITGAAPAPADDAVPSRPPIASGLAVDQGSPIAALRWIVPSVNLTAPPSAVLVHNPGPGVAVVGVALLGPTGRTPLEGADGVEVPPGDGVVVSVPPVEGDGTTPARSAIEVTASSPVVVDRLAAFGTTELSLGPTVPVRLPRGPLSPLGG
jgi:hypothetical protein